MARCSTVGWLSMLGNLSREWEERWYLTKIKSDNNVSNVLLNRMVLVVVGALEDDDGSPEEQERLRWRYSSLSFRKIHLGSCFVCCVLRWESSKGAADATFHSVDGIQQEISKSTIRGLSNRKLDAWSRQLREDGDSANYSLLFCNAVSF